MPESSACSRPLKSHTAIFDEEIHEAVEELRRPAHGQLMSGLIAGVIVGFSVLLVATIVTLAPPGLSDLWVRLLIANAYAIGFVLLVMGRTDLFTEYTTIALLPVLTGDAPVRSLLRFWVIVYVANLIGGGLMALTIAAVGPELGVVDAGRFGALVRGFVEHPGWVMAGGATMSGWLMGLLSWLVVAGRESISQLAFIWIIGGVIGFGHLPHAITGTIEVMTATLHGEVGLPDLGGFLLWTTVGNVVGGVVFALMIRFSVLGSRREPSRGDGA